MEQRQRFGRRRREGLHADYTPESLYTLPMLLQGYAGEHDANWARFSAGAVLVSVPVMVLFYVLQRQLVSGLTSGGVKG